MSGKLTPRNRSREAVRQGHLHRIAALRQSQGTHNQGETLTVWAGAPYQAAGCFRGASSARPARSVATLLRGDCEDVAARAAERKGWQRKTPTSAGVYDSPFPVLGEPLRESYLPLTPSLSGGTFITFAFASRSRVEFVKIIVKTIDSGRRLRLRIPNGCGNSHRLRSTTPIREGVNAAGCASSYRPPVDPTFTTDSARYQKDLYECKQIAESYSDDVAEETGKGALIGGAVGAAGGAAIGAAAGSPGTGAAIGAVVGVAAGSAIGGTSAKKKYEKTYDACMRNRGYKLLKYPF